MLEQFAWTGAVAKPDHDVTYDAGVPIVVCEWTLFQNLVDPAGRKAADEIRLCVNDRLEEAKLGVAAVRYVEPPRLQRLHEHVSLASVCGGNVEL